MGCNNSHLRPLFRRCRRRRSKKEEVIASPRVDVIERNGSQDLLQGVQLLGASLRNSNPTPGIAATTKSTTDSPPATDSSAFCVPLLAQSEASSSQIDFFKMLDEKIEEGPDYDSEEEADGLRPRLSLPMLRLESGSERKPMLSAFKSPARESTLKFTHWSWDEDGD